MARTRMLVAHSRQFGFRVTDGFMSTNNSIDCRFAFGLQLRDSCSRISQFESKLLGFEFSFCMLACCPIAFAREALSLLRQAFKRGFELSRNLTHSFSNSSLRKQFSA